jgi:hypothetical protein
MVFSKKYMLLFIYQNGAVTALNRRMRAKEIISELHGVYDYRSAPVNTTDDLISLMTQLGFEVLSGGEYSLVFEKPTDPNFVVKVFNDPCYEAFIKFCKERPNDPFLPKFRGNGVRIRDRARMIRVERLSPLPHQTNDYSRILMLYNISKEPEDVVMWDLDDEQRAMVSTFADLRAALPNMCRLDMHRDNIMLRGQTPVIIDPFSHEETDGWASGVL